jgi:hypothetical protein
MKSKNYGIKMFKKLKKWFKKDILYIEMFKSFCPECHTKNVNKDDN